MNRLIPTAALLCLLSTTALAQNSTAISGAGAAAKSTSSAGAVAIGGGNATGGNATATGGNVNIAGAPANTTATVRNEGQTSVKTVPNAYSPGLAAAGIETCLGSVSGGGSWLGTGISFGGTIPDPDCTARLDARTLWSMGVQTTGPRGQQLRVAALRRLCLREGIALAMPEICNDAAYALRPVVVPQSTYMTASTTPILLIDGKTGKERLCNNYNEAGQKCVTWAYAAPVATTSPPKRKVKPAPPPLPKEITEGPAGPPL